MRKIGTVKWFNTTKGYGFITSPDSNQDVFVHISAVSASGMESLNENQAIEYELYTDKNSGKVSAVNLKIAQG